MHAYASIWKKLFQKFSMNWNHILKSLIKKSHFYSCHFNIFFGKNTQIDRQTANINSFWKKRFGHPSHYCSSAGKGSVSQVLQKVKINYQKCIFTPKNCVKTYILTCKNVLKTISTHYHFGGFMRVIRNNSFWVPQNLEMRKIQVVIKL